VTPLWRMPYQQQLEVCFFFEMMHNITNSFHKRHFCAVFTYTLSQFMSLLAFSDKYCMIQHDMCNIWRDYLYYCFICEKLVLCRHHTPPLEWCNRHSVFGLWKWSYITSLSRQYLRNCVSVFYLIYNFGSLEHIQCESKKVAPPPKLFAIFSLRLSIFPWNFASMLPVYIYTYYQFWSICLNI